MQNVFQIKKLGSTVTFKLPNDKIGNFPMLLYFMIPFDPKITGNFLMFLRLLLAMCLLTPYFIF